MHKLIVYNTFKLRCNLNLPIYNILKTKYSDYEDALINGIIDTDDFINKVANFTITAKQKEITPEFKNNHIPKIIEDDDYLYTINGEFRTEKYVALVIYRNQINKIIRCINSITKEHRDDVGILIIDDDSTDGSYELVKSYINHHHHIKNVTLIQTKKRYGKTCNYYNAHYEFIHDESIIVLVDGDDYLASDRINIFEKLDTYYNNDYLATYGKYIATTYNHRESPDDYIPMQMKHSWNGCKCNPWVHLKTYKNKLFKQIPKILFKENDDDRAWLVWGEDTFSNAYMIELAYPNVTNITDVMYIYDVDSGSHWYDDALKTKSYSALKFRRERFNIPLHDIIRKYYNNWEVFMHDYVNNQLPVEILYAKY